MAWRASAYFDLVREEGAEVRVDDKTWLDLEFPKIFSRLDTTITPLGSQYLFASLRTYADDPQELAARHACADMLRRMRRYAKTFSSHLPHSATMATPTLRSSCLAIRHAP